MAGNSSRRGAVRKGGTKKGQVAAVSTVAVSKGVALRRPPRHAPSIPRQSVQRAPHVPTRSRAAVAVRVRAARFSTVPRQCSDATRWSSAYAPAFRRLHCGSPSAPRATID